MSGTVGSLVYFKEWELMPEHDQNRTALALVILLVGVLIISLKEEVDEESAGTLAGESGDDVEVESLTAREGATTPQSQKRTV